LVASRDFYEATANEPRVRPLLKKSFVFVPSAGMRLAPEILVLELMRELFFPFHYSAVGTKDFEPDLVDERGDRVLPETERIVLHAMRGRQKLKGHSGTSFYAPAYPQLAKYAWLGKKRERVIYNFLLAGPIAQHLWYKGYDSGVALTEQREIASQVINALVGQKSCFSKDLHRVELLAATLGYESFQIDRGAAEARVVEKTKESEELDAERTRRDPVMKGLKDQLADRIVQDLLALCSLDSELARMQWIPVIMTFLRFSLPIWMLAQMRITRLIHEWMVRAMDGSEVPSQAVIMDALGKRNRGLLHPTLTATREVFEHTERYMKARVELDILVRCLEEVRPHELSGKALCVEGGGTKFLAIESLLLLAKGAVADIRSSERFRSVAIGETIQTFLVREGEGFAAWRDPLSRGQGKNIDEFLRVLYRAEPPEEMSGHLLVPEGRGDKRGFRVFPGPLLLKAVTYLATSAKRLRRAHGGSGILVLEDIEEHFADYGVDFSMAADARPQLMNELQDLGLLSGSPDAGGSVSVTCPFGS